LLHYRRGKLKLDQSLGQSVAAARSL